MEGRRQLRMHRAPRPGLEPDGETLVLCCWEVLGRWKSCSTLGEAQQWDLVAIRVSAALSTGGHGPGYPDLWNQPGTTCPAAGVCLQTSPRDASCVVLSEAAARAHGGEDEGTSSTAALGLAEPPVPGHSTGSGHAGSVRLEPENTNTPTMSAWDGWDPGARPFCCCHLERNLTCCIRGEGSSPKTRDM
ncbi:uncharacterized protein LJ264_009445 isoform 1-T1 [Porphyrio hochstetteri]